MEFKANCGIWGTMFGVPCIVADNFLKLASGQQIKVLLYLLRNSGKDCTAEEVASGTGSTVQEVNEAVAFWEQVNVFSATNPDRTAQETSVPAAFPMTAPGKAVIPAAEQTEPAEKPKNMKHQKQNLNPQEISKRLADSPDIAALKDAVENLLVGLNHTRLNSLIWMYDYLGLKTEVIYTLIKYCYDIGKTNQGYIDSIASNWAENDINTLKDAQEKVTEMLASHDFCKRIAKTFCMARNLTSNEREIADKWQLNGYSFELIEYAYELTVEKIEKPSFKYIDAILERWKQDGLTTVSEVKNNSASYRKNRSSAGKKEDDFNADEYSVIVNRF